MVAYILLAAVGAVGALGIVAMVRVSAHALAKQRQLRERERMRARLAEERPSRRQPATPAIAAPERVATPAPLARGDLTSVLTKLEESVRFARVRVETPLAPPPVIARPPARLPKASVSPPPMPFAAPRATRIPVPPPPIIAAPPGRTRIPVPPLPPPPPPLRRR